MAPISRAKRLVDEHLGRNRSDRGVLPAGEMMRIPNFSGLSGKATKNIDLNGFITGKPVGAFGYVDHQTTTITEADVYQPIAGTFNIPLVEGFTVIGGSEIRYDEELQQYFEVDWHATVSANFANTTVHCALFKNGELVLGSEMSTFCKNLNQQYNLSGTAPILLGKNDTATLVVRSDGTGDEIEFHHYTATISEFFD